MSVRIAGEPATRTCVLRSTVEAEHPDKVLSLSLHGGCPTSDDFIKTIIAGWQVLAEALNSVPEMVIRSSPDTAGADD